MAQEETHKPATATEKGSPGQSPELPPQLVLVNDNTPVTQKEVPVLAPVEEKELAVMDREAAQEAENPAAAEEGTVAVETDKQIVQARSFKKESNVASELLESQRKALEEFRELVWEALKKRELTAPLPIPEKEDKKEDKVEEKKTEEETTEEKKKEEKKEEPPAPEEKQAAPKTTETKEEKPTVPTAPETNKEEKLSLTITETKKEDKHAANTETKEETTAAPATNETTQEEKLGPPASTETKKVDTQAALATIETRKEEKPAARATTEAKKEEKPAAPATTETKKEEKPGAPATTESKKEEKPRAPATTETIKEEKPVTSMTTETIKEEKPVTPATTETKKEEKPADQVTTGTKKDQKPAAEMKPVESSAITIEKAFATEEDGAKTVTAMKETIVPVSASETTAPAAEAAVEEEPVEPEKVSIWGVPLLQDERSDVVLLKFLRARDFKVKEAFTMLKTTVCWRKENNIDELVGEDLGGSEFEKIVFAHGVDKQGHVVIYSAYSEFQNKELFSDKEKLNTFLKWRIQFQEKCVRALDFSPSAKSSFLFVSDFKNAPGLGKRALWQFIKRAVKQFEDNYPEFSAKELFINVPWWYIPYYRTFGSIVTSPRTKSKMVLAGPSKLADTIFKYIAPEQVPVKYGGLSKEIQTESLFATKETVIEAIVKPTAKYTIDLPASEACTLSWELRVLGTDVSYGAQFEPSTEGSYTVIVSKNRKISSVEEPVITDSFKVGEPGKVVITIDNQTSKKKKLLYRFKAQPRSD